MSTIQRQKSFGGGGNPLLGKTKETHAMGLIPLILAVVIGATVITPMVGWMLSLNASISNIDGKLEAMSVATTEWNRLNSMSMEELESQASALSDYKVGDYQVLVDIGNKGHMADGSCKTSGLGADDKLNCYKDSKITIRKDNQTLYTSRLMPLSASQGDGRGYETEVSADGNNGYIKLSDGTLIQYGTSDILQAGENIIGFPIPFVNKIYTITGSFQRWNNGYYSADWSDSEADIVIHHVSNSSFSVRGSYVSNMASFSWIAVGRYK